MAYLKPDRTFDFGGVKVNEYLLTKHNLLYLLFYH